MLSIFARMVEIVVQSAALLALHSPAHYQITYIYYVAKFAYFFTYHATLEQLFCLFVEKIQTIPCAFQTKVGSHDTYVGAHYLSHFAQALCDEYHLFVHLCALVVPLRDIFIETVCVDY